MLPRDPRLKKKKWLKWAVHASKPCYETLQTGTAELVILPSQKNKQTSKQQNSCQVRLCMWMLPVVLSPNMLLWDTSVQALLLKLHMPYVHYCSNQCQVSGIFCVWYFHLPLRLWNKISPDFCYKHSIDRNLWAVLLLTWVCSGAFQNTLRNTRLWIKCISHSVLCIRWPST